MYYAIRRKSDGKFLQLEEFNDFGGIGGACLFSDLSEAASQVDSKYVGDSPFENRILITDTELEIVGVHISIEQNPITVVYGDIVQPKPFSRN